MSTDVESPDDLRLTVARLQAHNRWLAVFTALVGLGLVLSVISPVSTARSRRYQLYDESGRQRGMWRVRDGAAAMILQDNGGRWLAVTAIDADGARLSLAGRRGPLITLSTPEGQAFFTMHDRQGQPRLQMTVSEDGGRLVFLDSEGQVTTELTETRR